VCVCVYCGRRLYYSDPAAIIFVYKRRGRSSGHTSSCNITQLVYSSWAKSKI